MAAVYQLLTTTRYDSYLQRLSWNNDVQGPCSFLLLPYHFDRLKDAAARHAWPEVSASLQYDAFKAACVDAVAPRREIAGPAQAFRIRCTLAETGVLTVQVGEIPAFEQDPTRACFFNPLNDAASLYGEIFTVYVDPTPTPSSIFTSTKTTSRAMYDSARDRVRMAPIPANPAYPPPSEEVLLHNERDIITEGSISNIAIYRSRRWLTPRLDTGCLPGVMRRWLIEQGRIYEGQESVFQLDSIRAGDWVLLFNGVQGCRLGRIRFVSPA